MNAFTPEQSPEPSPEAKPIDPTISNAVPDLSKLVLPKGLRIKNNHVTIAPRFASRKNRGAQAGAFGRPKYRD